MNIQAIFSQRRGVRRQIADALGIYPSAVSQWSRVPAERVIDVERVTGISRHELRPDLYPAPSGDTGAASSTPSGAEAAATSSAAE